MKRRILCLMASLLLCGVVSAQNHWGDDPDSHAQPSNTPIVATVQINGNTVGNTVATPTSDYRLGAFIDGNLWGIAAPHTDGKFWIQVFYETAGEEISFKLYDGQNEYTTCTVVEPTTMTAVTTSEAGAVVTLNFTNGQTVELAAGWNWWSTNVETTLDELETALGNKGVSIKYQDELLSYSQTWGFWMGDIDEIVPEKMYKICVSQNVNITLNGTPVNPANHPITISPGSNWIGCPIQQTMSLSEAFVNFTPAAGDAIKSADGSLSSYSAFFGWMGDIESLEPGHGYIYISKANNIKTLTFPSN